jgi:pantoate--beta-alanine ligase
MSDALFLDIEIVPCPTKREADGLAMSSRNLRLTPAQREVAPRLYQILKTASSVEQARADLERGGFRVDYVEEYFGRRFAAAFLGDVRLIDNVTT